MSAATGTTDAVTNRDAIGALLASQEILLAIRDYVGDLGETDGLVARQHIIVLRTLADAALEKVSFGNEVFSELLDETSLLDAPVSEALAKEYC